MSQFSCLIVLLLSLATTNTWARTIVSLESLLERGRNQHPEKFLYEHRLGSLSAMKAGVPYLPGPMLSYDEMSSVTMANMKASEWQLRQVVPFPYKTYLSRQLIEREVDAMTAEREQKQLSRESEIRRTFFRWLATYKKMQIKKEQEILVSQLTAVQRTRYVAQKASQVELVALQVDRGNLLAEISELEIELARARVEVEQLAGPGESLAQADPQDIALPLEETKNWSRQQILEQLENQNLELRTLRAMNERSQMQVSEARANWVPNLELMLSKREDPLMGRMNGWGVGLEIPIWLAGEQRSMVGQAKAKALYSELEFQEQKRRMVLQVEALLSEQRELRRQLQLMENGLVQWSKQNVKSARAGYQTGTIDYAEFLALIQSSFQTLVAYEDLKVKVLDNQQQIRLIMGRI